jgi:hypothetical protein
LIVSGIIICQVNRLSLATTRDVEERSDVAVAQCARELQASVDEHADAPAEKFFGSNGRPELASLLRCVADLVEPALDPLRLAFESAPSGWYPRRGDHWRDPLHVRRSRRKLRST